MPLNTGLIPASRGPDSAETNPLPKVSSAQAWGALASRSGVMAPMDFPKATPVIREKQAAPQPGRRVRVDGTEEICVEDIMLIVPKASAPPARAKQPSPEARAYGAADSPKGTQDEELGDGDIVVEHAPPVQEEFRPPAFSVHATQEILADDVLEVAEAHRDEIPSTVPWTVDAGDDLEFPNPPQYSGPYQAVSPRITSYSATQVFRRRSANLKVVVGSLSLAAAVVLVAGVARLAPTSNAEGPVGISVRAPKRLDSAVRSGTLAYGAAPHVREGVAISIDALPEARSFHARRWRR